MDEIAKQNRDYGLEPVPLIAVNSILLFITTVFLGLRLYVRSRILKTRLTTDDWLLIVSHLFFMVFASATISLGWLEYYMGPIAAVYRMIQNVLVLASTYVACIVFLKMALAAFYMRFLTSRWQRNTIIVIIVLNTIYYIGGVCVTIFQCGEPLPSNFVFIDWCPIQWDVQKPINYIGGVANCITDWLLTIIPVLNIASLRLKHRDKILACSLVGVGALASVISIVRIFLLPRIRITGDLFYFREIQPLIYVSMFEVSIGICAMCASSFRPLWSSVAGRTRATGEYGRSTSQSGPVRRSTRREHDATLLEQTHLCHANVVVVAGLSKPGKEGGQDFITEVKEPTVIDLEKGLS